MGLSDFELFWVILKRFWVVLGWFWGGEILGGFEMVLGYFGWFWVVLDCFGWFWVGLGGAILRMVRTVRKTVWKFTLGSVAILAQFEVFQQVFFMNLP